MILAWLLAVVVICAVIVLYHITHPPKSLFPCSLLQLRTPEHADTEVSVSGLVPGAKVIYWAAEPATEGLARINDWRKAYLDFANAGVTEVSESGHAIMKIRKPQSYTVPVMGRIASHVHWRVCKEGGNIGPVQTTPIAE